MAADSNNYINVLYKFYDACLTHGAVRVTRQDSDVFTLYQSEKKFFHFTEVIAAKVGKVCWLYPFLAKNNLEILRKVIDYNDKGYLCTIRVIRGGRGFAVYVINSVGKTIYKKRCKYFSLNMFKIKKVKKSNKVNKSITTN